MADETATLVRLGDTDLTLANEVDDVRGRTVIDRNGDETGEVDGLVIDQAERKVRFLEVSSGGFLGMGKKQVLIPVDTVTRVDEEHVYVDKDRAHVASGPVYDPELTPEPERPYLEDVYGHYGLMPHWGSGYIYPGYPFR
ncbi:PRC-barrel domain-containing protein [Glycomyces sp. L485]|uniref:PRC-barrel domain-containing protein n=1 Tax=Glycomyces sp. L485 TaxID=2909235 RepID=UPI001F4A51DA|nr:PRC-barrel domain-containing protein [Glycomyces sp. L485]MCH7230768.1 PRC-barrel domain-containing protein [Glycomyces sp. L485]